MAKTKASPRKETFTLTLAGEHVELTAALQKKWGTGKSDVIRRALLEAAEREGLRKV